MKQPYGGIVLIGVLIIAGRQIDAVGQIFAEQLGMITVAVAAIPVAAFQSRAVGNRKANLNGSAGAGNLALTAAYSTYGGIPKIITGVLVNLCAAIRYGEISVAVQKRLHLCDTVSFHRGIIMVVLRDRRSIGFNIAFCQSSVLGFYGFQNFRRCYSLRGKSLQMPDCLFIAAKSIDMTAVESAKAVVVVNPDGYFICAFPQDFSRNLILPLNFPIGFLPPYLLFFRRLGRINCQSLRGFGNNF